MTLHSLARLVRRAAAAHPERLAVTDGVRAFTYRELDDRANRLARLLRDRGVGKGDRVGVWAEKSPLTVAAMQAVLRAGAAYVPIDAMSPIARAARILDDCSVKVLLTTHARSSELPPRFAGLETVRVDLEPYAAASSLHDLDDLEDSDHVDDADSAGEHDLAYILYTSGSTGQPKGVCISHRNALAFVEWAVRELRATEVDGFANHASFGFDLSVLDLYAAFSVGASVAIVPEGAAYRANALVDFVKSSRPTIWYSVPSALILMMDHGGLLDLEDLPMRAILFAGEPFPISYVRRLRERWPSVRLLNLYGPTETNVCTFHEVHAVDPERTRPVPIGRACSGDTVWVAREDGSPADAGEEGILVAEGPTVMIGYWGQPPQGAAYVTGDVVRQNADGDYEYLGRRDGMVKLRGFRVELGEIEAILAAHDAIREVAAIVTGEGAEAKLTAVAVAAGPTTPTLLELKKHCAERLPRYMILDRIRWVNELPRSANGKVDKKRVMELQGAVAP